MTRMTNNIITVLVASTVGLLGCATEDTLDPPPGSVEPGNTTGGEGNTFDHDNDGLSAWELLDRLQKEGPATYTSRVHSCPKTRVDTIDNLLASRGVNMTAGGALSARGLYNSGLNALGAPNYLNRVRENLSLTTASASRLFDIYVAAAPEIIAAFEAGTVPACAGAGPLFDAGNACNAAAFSCLLGVPATLAHVEGCSLTVTEAVAVGSMSAIEAGKRLAVAVMMAAAHTCE